MQTLSQTDIQQSDYQPSNFSGLSIRRAAWFITGLAVGAVAAYFLDPARGKRRRHVFRDQFFARIRDLEESTMAINNDLSRRVRGAYQHLISPPSEDVNDDTLTQRVRSEFGRKIRHTRSIQTAVSNGVVTLAGPVLSSEVQDLIRCVRRVPGVRRVINHLDVRSEADGISGLQGEGAKYLQ